MVLEQDDEMDMNSFVDLMEQVSTIPAYHTKRSRSEDADISVHEVQKPRRKMWAEQHAQQQHGNSLHTQRLDERNINPEEELDVKLNEAEEELEQRRREQPQRKPDQRRHYRQRIKMAEPLLVFGEFGQRNPNYSRPVTFHFNRSKFHDIPMAPSLYLLPPTVSAFLPQEVPTFTETPVPRSSRQRNRPRTHNSRSPVELSRPFSRALQVHDGTNPLASNISTISTDIPVRSTDTDISLVHIDIPRIYTTISHPHTDVSASPFTDISRVHIAISRQPTSSFRAANNQGGLHGTSSPNAFDISHEPTTVTPQSTETFQSADSFRPNAHTDPPAGVVPPLFVKLTKNSSGNEQAYVSEESEAREDVLNGNSMAYDSYQNEATIGVGRGSSRGSASSPVQAERGDRKHHRPASREYDELQLTAAETAYYKRRQLRKPAMILETSGECTLLSGIREERGVGQCMGTLVVNPQRKYRLGGVRINGRVIYVRNSLNEEEVYGTHRAQVRI
jgi:hypothetical protein